VQAGRCEEQGGYEIWNDDNADGDYETGSGCCSGDKNIEWLQERYAELTRHTSYACES
jgi:hypothetical protein